jgi:hypothetical protein
MRARTQNASLHCLDHRLGVRWSSHRFGQFIDPIVKVRAILAKLLEQCDHLGDFLFAQDRQLQIEQFAALVGARLRSACRISMTK